MFLTRAYHVLSVLLITLFVTFQIAASAHATEFNDTPHDHNGVECSLATIGQDDVTPLPVILVSYLSEIQLTESYVSSFETLTYLRPQGRSPPPRGPPTQIKS